MKEIQNLAESLLAFTKAKSIFLYGSRARNDFLETSDYEIGVLMEKGNYIGRTKINEKFARAGVRIFPFVYEDFVRGNPDTPFQKSIYLREIAEAGGTLAGGKIVENLARPSIALLDVLQDVRFNLGYALAATHSYRNGDTGTAALHFTKSCLFGTRDYVIFKKNVFAVRYPDVVTASRTLELGEYRDLPAYAISLREGNSALDERNLFLNISYLNQLIERELVASFEAEGNRMLVG